MQRTTRLRWPYPDEKQKGWYPLFKDMMSDMDSDILSVIEFTNTLIYGGEMVLNEVENTVTWSEEIGVYSLITGFRTMIDPGSVSGVEDGSVVFLEMSRPIDDLLTSVLSVESTLSTIRNRCFVSKRVGDELIMHPSFYNVVVL
jgi:hypothetical protein